MIRYFLSSILTVGAIGLMAMTATPAKAATVVYEVNTPEAGNQPYTGVLGMWFEVTRDILVHSLGAFDDDNDGIVNTLTTELWSRSGTSGVSILASDTFSSNDPGTLIGSSRFKDLSAPLLLTAGEYAIVSYGYSGDDLNGNKGSNSNGNWSLNNLGGAIVFGENRYTAANNATFGDNIGVQLDGGPDGRYAAGTFSATVVPVPASLPLLIAAIGGLGFMRRRSRA